MNEHGIPTSQYPDDFGHYVSKFLVADFIGFIEFKNGKYRFNILRSDYLYGDTPERPFDSYLLNPDDVAVWRSRSTEEIDAFIRDRSNDDESRLRAIMAIMIVYRFACEVKHTQICSFVHQQGFGLPDSIRCDLVLCDELRRLVIYVRNRGWKRCKHVIFMASAFASPNILQKIPEDVSRYITLYL